jgi:hypothetical protein
LMADKHGQQKKSRLDRIPQDAEVAFFSVHDSMIPAHRHKGYDVRHTLTFSFR